MVDEEAVTNVTRNIMKELKSMELKWTDDQKKLWKEKIQKSMNNNIRLAQHKDLLLKRCKQHGGPITSADELKMLYDRSKDEKILRSYLRAEVGFQKALHPFDARERSHLYKMNYLSVEQLTENLTILLDKTLSAAAGDELVQFPNEEEIFNIVKSKENEDIGLEEVEMEVEEKRRFTANEPVVVIWDEEKDRCWFIGFFICNVDDDTVKIDHLQPQKKGNRKNWIRPKTDDVQAVNIVQLLPIEVVGDWNFRNERQPVFSVDNAIEIEKVFQQYLD